MTYVWAIYNGEERIGDVRTNHSISDDQAYRLLGMEDNENKVNPDDADLIYNGKEYWLDDLSVVLE